MKSQRALHIFGKTFLGCLAFIQVNAAEPVDISKLSPPATAPVDFIRDVQPIFSRHCHSCHGPDKHENDLRLDAKSSALKGGESGPAIIPGKSAESRLIHLVAGLERGLVMPKKGERLSPEQIGLLRAWIDQGANWPDDASAAKMKDKADWWSFKPAVRPALPELNDKKWARNEIDLFILAKLDEQKLAPSSEADKRTLIRRLSFDLTGLPPTPDEVEQYVSDQSSQAYEMLVDRLLASPRYGERWARHWLDTVHYGDTHGYDKDKPRLNAWPYRDYVIRSFNNDKSYSHFAEEQLAGDVLFPDEPDGIVALGFIASGPWDFVGHVELPIEKTDGLIARYNDRDDMLMTAMSTFQSLTVHCARCHNHKFDAITQKDYYSLQAVFAGVDRADRSFDADKATVLKRVELAQETKLLEKRLVALTNRVTNLSSPEVRAIDKELRERKDRFGVLENTVEVSPSNGYHSGIEKTKDYVKWVQGDLKESFTIEQIRLVPARPIDFADTPGFGFPVRFRVEISSEENFETPEIIANHTEADFPSPGDKPVMLPASGKSARYVRVTATRLWERTSDFVFALGELQVFADGTNVAAGANVTSLDSIEAGYWSRKNLVDGFDSRKRLPETLTSIAAQNDREQLKREIEELWKKRTQLVEKLANEKLRGEVNEVTNRLGAIARELAALPPKQTVYAVANDFEPNGNFIPARTPRPVYLLARGDVKRPGDLMTAGAVAAVPAPNSNFAETIEKLQGVNPLSPRGTSGERDGERGNLEKQTSSPQPSPPLRGREGEEGARRAALAKWITDPANMLTRRSIVNRVWHYHFGRGIVETPNDFGHMGALPTHPELLDWLAFWFLDNGESLKKLHRLIVTSATYRQSSKSDSHFSKVDADNRFLWRMNRSRLDAETIRDSMLLISGKLDFTMGGPSVQQFGFKDDHSPVYDYTQFDVDSPAGFRRSIYRFTVRSVPDPLMDSLDCPDASILTPKRNVTMTALQALAVLNNPFVLKQCEHLAERLQKMKNGLPDQIEQAYSHALNRKPTAEEMKKLLPFAETHGLPTFCRLIFNTSEFMFVD